jgi:hypothetical protein
MSLILTLCLLSLSNNNRQKECLPKIIYPFQHFPHPYFRLSLALFSLQSFPAAAAQQTVRLVFWEMPVESASSKVEHLEKLRRNFTAFSVSLCTEPCITFGYAEQIT